jgi:hypothetical protein
MCTNEVIKEDEFRTFLKMHSCLLPMYFPVTNDTGREFGFMVRVLSNVVNYRDSHDLPCPSPVPDVSRPPFSIVDYLYCRSMLTIWSTSILCALGFEAAKSCYRIIPVICRRNQNMSGFRVNNHCL